MNGGNSYTDTRVFPSFKTITICRLNCIHRLVDETDVADGIEFFFRRLQDLVENVSILLVLVLNMEEFPKFLKGIGERTSLVNQLLVQNQCILTR